MTASEPEYLVEHIHEALAERAGELGVRATLTATGVFLTGEVGSPEQQQVVGAVVSDVAPDHAVHNQTTVMDYPEPQSPEQLT